jgi:hypothetical protein
MNDELQGKLVEVLTGISEGVSQAKDFAVDQLPDVAQQYIMFGMVWETVAFVSLFFGSLVFAYGFKFGVNWKKKLKEEEGIYSDDIGPFMVMLLSAISFLLSALLSLDQLKAVLMVWFAPKLYLLQGIAELIK